MDNFKNKLVDQCLDILKRDDVKQELKMMLRPMIDMIVQELYPYIFLSIVFVFISFLLILGIFILLLKNKLLVKSTGSFLKYKYSIILIFSYNFNIN